MIDTPPTRHHRATPSPAVSVDPASAALTRTAQADQLAGRWLSSRKSEEPPVQLRSGEAAVIVALLGEVDKAYRGEPLGALAARIGQILTRRAGP